MWKTHVKNLDALVFYCLLCFPECRNTRSLPWHPAQNLIVAGNSCAKNKGTRKEFYGCTNYPECDFISHYKPINASCPECGYFLVEKYDKKNGSYKSCINPECDYLHSTSEAEEKKSEEIAQELAESQRALTGEAEE